jgi:prepilin-type N-terminal cleavage/methylation domain-containing protein
MMDQLRKKRADGGFTLVELLITIVIIGILAAVVILAIGGLTDSGEKSACTATKDAAETAAIAYYSDNSGSTTPWPTSYAQLVPQYLTLKSGVTNPSTTTVTGSGWTLTLSGGGATQTAFNGCATTATTAAP